MSKTFGLMDTTALGDERGRVLICDGCITCMPRDGEGSRRALREG